MILTGFFRCNCGKIHTQSCIGPNTVCACGENLYRLRNNREFVSKHSKPVTPEKVSAVEAARKASAQLRERQSRG